MQANGQVETEFLVRRGYTVARRSIRAFISRRFSYKYIVYMHIVHYTE